MRPTIAEIRRLIFLDGFVVASEHPELRRSIYHLAETGLLRRLHPGVFVAASAPVPPDARTIGAARGRSDAVLTLRAAARLTFWRDLPVPEVVLAHPKRQRPWSDVTWVERTVPPEWVVTHRRARLTHPALTTVDLLPELRGDVLTRALRAGVRIETLWEALDATRGRRGNAARRRLLHGYRDLPWSPAEQELHLILRRHRARGWRANVPMVVAGRDRVVDVTFDELKVAIEVDGHRFHAGESESRQRFEDDREVANWLTAHGWLVLRFTWRQLTEQPEQVWSTILTVLRLAESRSGRRA